MLPLYFDEDSMDRDLVTALRARGADVVTAADAGMLGRSDPDHLEYAAAQGRILYTFNRGDFIVCILVIWLKEKLTLESFWRISSAIRSVSRCARF